jgi:kynurenine 3-monooxygenase
MNCGFEDCTVLSTLLDEVDGFANDQQWESILNKYSELRKPAGDAILDLALHNYIVMRDKTMDPVFQLQKKIESLITAAQPDRWKPLYTLVTFTHIPYEKAWRLGQLQQAVMNHVMSQPDIETRWNSPEILELVIETLDKYESDSSFLDTPTSLLSLDV